MRRYSQAKKSYQLVKIVILAALLAILVVVLVKFFKIEKHLIAGPRTVVQLITDSGLKSSNGRVNILLLGTGGYGHEGPDLTDTIILASVARDGSDVVLVSIPRDLWVPAISAKINSAYAFGQEQDGQGLTQAQKTVSELFGLPIHYGARVDFAGFVRAVDLVDGIDVNVENPFTDSRYPLAGKEDDLCGLTLEQVEIDGASRQVVKDATGSAIPLDEIGDQNDPFTCRYEEITFQKGPTHLDGTTALKFVRSRYGTNEEGSDFKRSARQQKVIVAFRDKVFSLQTFLEPSTIIDLMTTFGQSIDTNVQGDEVPLFIKLSQKINPQNVRRLVLDADRPESVLAFGNPQDHGGQFVLVPQDNNWHDLAEYIQGEIFKLQEK